jgi:D-xylose transport system ATP-binding protein
MVRHLNNIQKGKQILNMIDIGKSFSGVSVLQNVNVQANAGEVLAILGQNGAGKSTLMKVLAGFYPFGNYEGVFYVNGIECNFSGIKAAEENGIIMIPQEIEVFPYLTVAENLLFNQLSKKKTINWNQLTADAKAALEEFEIRDIDPSDMMINLTRAQHQLILIIKALVHSTGKNKPSILILDEPTASLTESETLILFKHLERVKESGVACIYISHRLGEVFKIADRFVIIRDGLCVGEYSKCDTCIEEIITSIVGKKLVEVKKTGIKKLEETLLSVKGLNVFDKVIKNRKLVDNLSFDLHAGEIMGVFGLLGSGKTETALSLFGAWEGSSNGQISIKGESVEIISSKKAIALGIGLLTEDRREALMEVRSIKENIVLLILKTLTSKLHLLNKQKEMQKAIELQDKLKLKARSLEDLPSTLSGGNKQKVLVARLLGAGSQILIADEPTVGVDVNTRQELYTIFHQIAKEQRCGILMFSSDVEEILQVSDQVMVLKSGKIAGFFNQKQLSTGTINQDTLLHVAAGQ